MGSKKKGGSGDEPAWVGLDLGGTKMLAVVYDAEYRERGRKKKKTRAHEGAKSGVARMGDLLEDALSDAKVDADEVAGIGVGCAGLVHPGKGILVETPNLGWKDVPLADMLSKRFGCPVVLANDVDAGVYGEHRFGAGKGSESLVGIFPGTGIGGGFVSEGRIVSGHQRSGFEIGHLPVMPDGPLCGCGQRGCLEAVASRLAIASAAATAARRGQAPYLMEHGGADLEQIRSRLIADSIAGGDQVVEAIVRDAARWVGIGIAAMVNLLVPRRIVLGGELIEALPDLYLDEATRSANARVMTPYRDRFDVVVAELGDDAVVMGAAAWAATSASKPKAEPDG